MVELMQVLTDEDIVPRRYTGIFTGALTRAKIEAAVGVPFVRNVSFLLRNATKMWLVTYDQATDEYWYEELTKAV